MTGCLGHREWAHGAGHPLRTVWRGRDWTDGVRHPASVLGMDAGGGREAARLSDVRLTMSCTRSAARRRARYSEGHHFAGFPEVVMRRFILLLSVFVLVCTPLAAQTVTI